MTVVVTPGPVTAAALTSAQLSTIETNIDEEAWVLEILNELASSSPTDSRVSLQEGLVRQLNLYGENAQIGFYLDEFGAKQVREIGAATAVPLLAKAETWDSAHEPKLHVFRLSQGD